jgi:DNA-binding NarL/FixJ family response regulator
LISSPNDSAPIRVLIADDEPDVRLLLRIQLEHEGFEIVGEASDGQAALDACVDTKPEVLILDLLMPGVNGFEAIPKLRRQHPNVAIVAYTAVAGDFVRQEMVRMRIPLLLKSGDVTSLAATVRKLAEALRSA